MVAATTYAAPAGEWAHKQTISKPLHNKLERSQLGKRRCQDCCPGAVGPFQSSTQSCYGQETNDATDP